MRLQRPFPVFLWTLALFALCNAALFALSHGSRAQQVTTHALAKEYVWYCRPPKKGSAQPRPSEKAPFIANYPVLYIGNAEEPVIYLTFDDDTDECSMNALLDVLASHKVRAAFFLNEEFVRNCPNTVRRMTREGHLVCNHTDRHIYVSAIRDFGSFVRELNGVEDAYQKATGQPLPKFFRPPSGRFSELTLLYAQKMGYTTVFWSYCYVDWQEKRQPSRSRAIKDILKGTHNGEILLLHAQSATNQCILDDLLCNWERMGYRFGTLDELVPQRSTLPRTAPAGGDSPANGDAPASRGATP